MDFEKFFILASEILNNNSKNNTWYGDDLAVLTSTNYGVYLVEAFGGQLSDIKIYSSIQPKPYNFSRTADQGRYTHFNDTFIDQGKGAYKNYLNKLNNERFNTDNTPSSEVGFIPLSFEIVLEGISGIKIYNKLSVNTDFLPSNYPESLNFIITKVNHQISNNNWDTSLSTISIPNTEPYQLSRYASFGGTNTGNTGGGNSGGGTGSGGTNRAGQTKYPELPLLNPAPGGDTWLFKDAKKVILSLTSDINLAKAIFAMIWSECSKVNNRDPDTGAFISAGGHNYTGTQTDAGRWGKDGDPFIIGRFEKNDRRGLREFAEFASNESHIEFLKVVLTRKGFDKTKDAGTWAERYLNSWNFYNLSTNNKALYDSLLPLKSAFYTTAINMWNQLK